jgi:hypothetical protein
LASAIALDCTVFLVLTSTRRDDAADRHDLPLRVDGDFPASFDTQIAVRENFGHGCGNSSGQRILPVGRPFSAELVFRAGVDAESTFGLPAQPDSRQTEIPHAGSAETIRNRRILLRAGIGALRSLVFFRDQDRDDVACPHRPQIFVEIGPAIFFLPERPCRLRRRQFRHFGLARFRGRRTRTARDDAQRQAAQEHAESARRGAALRS